MLLMFTVYCFSLPSDLFFFHYFVRGYKPVAFIGCYRSQYSMECVELSCDHNGIGM